jgi:hypothetical protein
MDEETEQRARPRSGTRCLAVALGGDRRFTLKYAEALNVLRLIEAAAGTTTEEGMTCGAVWCGEQARAFLNTSNAGREGTGNP